MTDKDRYIIYKMWVLTMRGIILILTCLAKNTANDVANQDMFIGSYHDFCHALDNPHVWNWLRYGKSTSAGTSTSSDARHSASSEETEEMRDAFAAVAACEARIDP